MPTVLIVATVPGSVVLIMGRLVVLIVATMAGAVVLIVPTVLIVATVAGAVVPTRRSCAHRASFSWPWVRRWRSSSLRGVWQSGSYKAHKTGQDIRPNIPRRVYAHERQLPAARH